MINLRPIQLDEYAIFCEYFIDDYSREIVDNYGLSLSEAIEQAKKDLNTAFPNGPLDSEHDLLCIETTIDGQITVVGYLWHLVNKSDKTTFIYDFYISEVYRGKGIGTQIISIFEKQLKKNNIVQIKLRVAYFNKRALKLYQSVGFSVTGYNMSKKL